MVRSRTQSPQDLWPAVDDQERIGNSKKKKYFDWLPCNRLHCNTQKSPCLSWQATAGQIYPEDSGYELFIGLNENFRHDTL